MSLLCCLGYIVVLVLIYKALDWLIRLLYLGRNADRYILVTGCDTGFGNVLAKRLDKLGCHVFAGCLTTAGGEELKKECSDRLKVVSLDVSNTESVKRAFELVKAALPEGTGIWGVMNNAGISGAIGPIEWCSVQDYKDVLAINTYGLIDVSMTFLPLVKLERGRIVNTASVFGRYCLAPITPYCVAKYGVEAFTDGLRRSLYPFGVKAILIEPGLHKTNISSQQNSLRWMEKAWNQCSPETKAEYGEDFYKYYSTQGIKNFDIGSERISDVVDAYHHALLGRFPRARYMPGKDAKYLWMPLQWMPEWLGDFIMFNFDPKQPLPAALRKKDQ